MAQEKLKLRSFVLPEKELKEHPLSEGIVDVCHKRLRHGSSSIMRKLFPVSSNVINKILNRCSFCPCAKQTRSIFLVSSIKSRQLFDLVHLDVWGTYKKPTFDGYRFFLTLIDDFSRMSWLFLLKNKSDVCVALAYFLKYVFTQFDKTVKEIKSNNDIEFINSVRAKLLSE